MQDMDQIIMRLDGFTCKRCGICCSLLGIEHELYVDEEDVRRCESVMTIQKGIVRSLGTKDPFRCFSLDKRYYEDCVAVLLLMSAARSNKNPKLCDLFPESWKEFAFFCIESFRDELRPSDAEIKATLPQIRSVNSLLKRDGERSWS